MAVAGLTEKGTFTRNFPDYNTHVHTITLESPKKWPMAVDSFVFK